MKNIDCWCLINDIRKGVSWPEEGVCISITAWNKLLNTERLNKYKITSDYSINGFDTPMLLSYQYEMKKELRKELERNERNAGLRLTQSGRKEMERIETKEFLKQRNPKNPSLTQKEQKFLKEVQLIKKKKDGGTRKKKKRKRKKRKTKRKRKRKNNKQTRKKKRRKKRKKKTRRKN